MEEQLISFETAKLAKEKDFNELCDFLYHDDGNRDRVGNANNLDEEEFISYACPTQSLLQKWIREIYKINILIHPNQMNNNPITYVYCLHYKYGYQSKMTNWSKFKYSSYEEALEIGLQEALKLIKT